MASQISGSGLYNGNITWQITQLNRLAESLGNSNDTFGIRASAYKYDQLNRLLSTATFTSNNSGVLSVAKNKWNASYSYDRNGNIRTASVRGNGNTMDSLKYNYAIDGSNYLTTNNRLNSVTDLTGSANDGTYATDINSNQGGSNYTYDAIGNLTGDVAEGSTISWTVSGKVRKVTKTGIVIDYNYDAAGNRVSKKVTTTSNNATVLTQYVRDAAGNVLASYIDNSQSANVDVEYNLYGSSRIGRVLASGIIRANVSIVQPASKVYTFKPGLYQYELCNHLGNVQAVITGLKLGEDTDGNTATAELYRCSVVSLSDYYSFGMEIEGRTYVNASAYRFGFNGKEKDIDIAIGDLDFGARIYDSRLGRWMSTDPLEANYPFISPYAFGMNSPILMADEDGRYAIVSIKKFGYKDGKEIQLKKLSFRHIYRKEINVEVHNAKMLNISTFEHTDAELALASQLLQEEIIAKASYREKGNDDLTKGNLLDTEHKVRKYGPRSVTINITFVGGIQPVSSADEVNSTGKGANGPDDLFLVIGGDTHGGENRNWYGKPIVVLDISASHLQEARQRLGAISRGEDPNIPRDTKWRGTHEVFHRGGLDGTHSEGGIMEGSSELTFDVVWFSFHHVDNTNYEQYLQGEINMQKKIMKRKK